MKFIIVLSLIAPHAFGEGNNQGFDTIEQLSQDALSLESDAFPSGKVITVLDMAGYTYFQFIHKDAITWAATSTISLKEGDKVVITKSRK